MLFIWLFFSLALLLVVNSWEIENHASRYWYKIIEANPPCYVFVIQLHNYSNAWKNSIYKLNINFPRKTRFTFRGNELLPTSSSKNGIFNSEAIWVRQKKRKKEKSIILQPKLKTNAEWIPPKKKAYNVICLFTFHVLCCGNLWIKPLKHTSRQIKEKN